MDLELLNTIPFFCDISMSEMEHVAHFITRKMFSRGSFVFMEGEISNEFYIVQSGIVEISRVENGRKFVLSTVKSGDFFGEMSLFVDGSLCSTNVSVLEKAELLVMNRRDFKTLLDSNPELTCKILIVVMQRLRAMNERIYDLACLDVRSRIYKQIVLLMDEYGTELDQAIMINLRLTHQQIADMVGCTREMVSKVLSELQAAHIIAVKQKRIIVKNRNQLMEKVV